MLRTGLIGYSKSGKTTLFQLVTSHHEPPHGGHGKLEVSVGVARVPDARLDRLTAMFPGRKRVPATVEFADLAAAGRTAAQSLLDVAAFRDADALVHVVRAFRDESVPREGSTEPARDAQAIEDELILADLGIAERRLERIDRDLKKAKTADLEKERPLIARCKDALETGTPIRALALDHDDRKRLRGFQFLSAKPLLIVVNLDESDLAWLAVPGQAAERVGLAGFLSRAATRAVGVCARIELEIAQLEPSDAAAFLADFGLHEAGVDRVICATYDLLGYLSFFTVGEDECRAWSVPRGTVAHVAAGEIHTDMARGFIRAEVVTYEHLVSRGAFHACREHGEVRLEGRDYVVQDGDVITFRFAT